MGKKLAVENSLLNPGLMLLWGLVVVSALIQISVVHNNRLLVREWEAQERLRQTLKQDQTRLTLELSTLTDFSRIDQRARNELNMVEPKQVRVITQ
ncbi:MAG: cell division protein FtsL [Oceanobacter sp.]